MSYELGVMSYELSAGVSAHGCGERECALVWVCECVRVGGSIIVMVSLK
jgi:hypothetical protein